MNILRRIAMRYTKLWIDWALPTGALLVTLIVLLVVWRWDHVHAYFTRPLTEVKFGDLVTLGAIWALIFRGGKK
jgi:hypothetical protein